jgi:predicted Fe-S protein YdhL (DUF1289 family)
MSVASPCTKVCTLDPASGLCVGCGRTGDEIGRWAGMSEAEQRALVAVLPRRLAALAGQNGRCLVRRPVLHRARS